MTSGAFLFLLHRNSGVAPPSFSLKSADWSGRTPTSWERFRMEVAKREWWEFRLLAVGSYINPALQLKNRWFKQQIIYLYPRRLLFCSKWVLVFALRWKNGHITPVRKETQHVCSTLQFVTEAAPIPKLVWCSCNELLWSRVAKQYVGHQAAQVSLSARSSCSTTTDAALPGSVWPSPACGYI